LTENTGPKNRGPRVMNGRQVRIQERKDHIAGLENAGRTFCTWWQMKIQVTCDFIVYKKLSYRRGTTRRSTAAQCTALLKKSYFKGLQYGMTLMT